MGRQSAWAELPCVQYGQIISLLCIPFPDLKMEEILAHIKLPIIHAHIIEVMCNEPVKRFIFTINYQEKPFSTVPWVCLIL